MRLTVIGVGLIGASFALAAKKFGLVSHVCGFDHNSAHLEVALNLGIIDEVVTQVDSGDLLVVAVANENIAELVVAQDNFPGIVMDVGSVKAPIIKAIRALAGECPSQFVPCHPVAGSEHSGPQAASADLFQQQTVVLTPLEETSATAITKVTEIWQACGARVITHDMESHDRLLATTSHLPHLLAFIYESLIHDEHQLVTGGGYRDFSRIANSDRNLWQGILQLNKAHLLNELERFEALLSEGKHHLKVDDPQQFAQWLKKL